MKTRIFSRLFYALFFMTLAAVAGGLVDSSSLSAQTTGGTIYYVSCVDGNDANAGTGESTAWRTIGKANSQALAPGDKLLLQRGCAWQEMLRASWHGTATNPIVIGAYGSGALPRIENGTYNNVLITGSYQIIENLHAHYTPTTVDANCQYQPTGYVIGFHLFAGASYNQLRSVESTGHTIGARFAPETHHNKLLYSRITDNNVLEVLDTKAGNDRGAWGVRVSGNDNEIAYTYFSGNVANCSYDAGTLGTSIEIFSGQRNRIHHNTANNERHFVSLAGNVDKAADNEIAYNLHMSTAPRSLFLITRGAKDSAGPAWRTKVYHNTVYLTDSASQGVNCLAGCNAEILTLRNNIIHAEAKALFADAPFNEGHNLYWNQTGSPLVQLIGGALASSSLIADPQFVDPSRNDFRLSGTSPAVDKASTDGSVAGYTTDLDNQPVPQSSAADIGVYEFGGAPLPTATPTPVLPQTYYVSCVNGNDANAGTGEGTAWRSIEKANRADLRPGDQLLLQRGCVWEEMLRAYWHGTADQPIVIGAYGDGALPKIQNRPGDLDDRWHTNVDVQGSYLIIEYIETTIVSPPVDPGCANTPVGYYVGFNFRNPNNVPNGASYNLMRFVKASYHTIGASLHVNTHHNRILNSTFANNNVMHVLTPATNAASHEDPGDDIGAWGILLRGRNHEVAHNTFRANVSLCTYDTPPQGNAIELYEAQDNTIHHNVSLQDRHFSELGGSDAIKSNNNAFVYNLVVSSLPDARFIIARGGQSKYGPTSKTLLYHNTVYYTGAETQAVVCGAGCGPEVMSAHNNIFWAEEKAFYADRPFDEGHNLYWNQTGTPFLQFVGFDMAPSSLIADPQFVDPAGQDFHLRGTSPAVDRASTDGSAAGYTADLDNRAVPQSNAADIGVYEFGGAALPTATPTATSTPTPVPTNTATPTATSTPTSIPTNTATPTATSTPTSIPTNTATPIATEPPAAVLTPEPITEIVPNFCTISLDGGALFTSSRTVEISANVPGAAQMQLSNDGGFSDAVLQPFQPTVSWTLRDTSGYIATQVVYARFVDASGNLLCGGNSLSDDIVYDPVPPKVSGLAVDGSVRTADDGRAIVVLSIEAYDQENGSGLGQMQISTAADFQGVEWIPFSESTEVDAEAGQILYVRIQDSAGNISTTETVTVPAAVHQLSPIYLPLVQQ